MKGLFVAAAMLAVALPSLAQRAEPPVSIRTEGLPAHVAARLQEKARLGMTELVRYVNRTRMMGHQVYLPDLLVDEPVRRRAPRRVPGSASAE